MTILVVVPTLNEEPHIRRVINQLLAGSEDLPVRLVVVDGGSTDGTTDVVLSEAALDDRVSLLQNPHRTQAAALNLAASLAEEEVSIIVRADCHANYPEDWVAGVTDSLKQRRSEGCVSVVVPMVTVGTTPVQRGISFAQNSVIGNGGSAHRRLGRSSYVDHGHHAALARDAFERVGGYDETMISNEDAELDRRLIAAGGRVYLDTSKSIEYVPRSSLPALARQYRNYGRGRAQNLVKHRTRPRLRQMVPLVITLVSLSAVLEGLDGRRPRAAQLSVTAYLAVCSSVALRGAWASRDYAVLFAAPAAVVSHHSWGVGFVEQLARGAGGRLLRSLRLTSRSSPLVDILPVKLRRLSGA